MIAQTLSNTQVSPMRVVPQLLCLAEWFCTRPRDFETQEVEYYEAYRKHDALFIDEAFDYIYNLHKKHYQSGAFWTRLSWEDKATLCLLEAEHLSTLLS